MTSDSVSTFYYFGIYLEILLCLSLPRLPISPSPSHFCRRVFLHFKLKQMERNQQNSTTQYSLSRRTGVVPRFNIQQNFRPALSLDLSLGGCYRPMFPTGPTEEDMNLTKETSELPNIKVRKIASLPENVEVPPAAARSATNNVAFIQGMATMKALVDNALENSLVHALEKQTVATATQLPNPQFQPSAKNYDSMAKGKIIMPDETPIKRPFKKAKSEQHKMTELGKDVLKRMVSVSTNGGIPNGREIKGFLVNYRTAPARIMCVCHGRCFTPAEFLKHASGREVPNPVQFIVLRPF